MLYEDIVREDYLHSLRDEEFERRARKVIYFINNGPLTEKERRRIIEYFGLNGRKPMTFEEIGKREFVSKQAVHKSVSRAMKKIAIYMDSELSKPNSFHIF